MKKQFLYCRNCRELTDKLDLLKGRCPECVMLRIQHDDFNMKELEDDAIRDG